MKTAQEVFDETAQHLFTQGRQAASSVTNVCKYRMRDRGKTLKCAVGYWIPDNSYNKKFERKICDALPTIANSLGITLPREIIEYTDLLGRLQIVHDNPDHWVSTEIMRGALLEVAKTSLLDCSKILKMKFKDK